MRLFAALVPPPAAYADLAAVVAAVRERWPDLGWIPSERWHVTLAFFGGVDERHAARLTTRLATAATRPGPFPLRVRGAGCFPSARQARVLWAGMGDEIAPLELLAQRATAAGWRSGIPVEERSFWPHLTLARVRPGPVDLTTLVAELEHCAGEPFVADELVLMRSHLGPAPRYERVASWPLGR